MKVTSAEIALAVSKLINTDFDSYGANDYSFIKRIYETDFNSYRSFLKQLGFIDLNMVLDAGCGFGQWSLALAELNKNIISLDIDPKRTQFLENITNELCIENIKTKVGVIDKLPFENSMVDAVFCFGAIFYSDWKKTLSEFSRILKPNGKLYLTANDIGWYMNCWVNSPNQTVDYDPRKIAANALAGTLEYENGVVRDGIEKIISIELMKAELIKNDLQVEFIRPEKWRGKSSYFGLCGVYECLSTRS